MKLFSQPDGNPAAFPRASFSGCTSPSRASRPSDSCTPNRWVIGAAICAVSSALTASAQNVLPGSDLWTTPAGGTTTEDFSGMPIPANFFGPGSDPFIGIIDYHGRPLEGTPSSIPTGVGIPGQADTIVARMGVAVLPGCPSTAQVPIEIVALSLISTKPITVTFFGGAQPTNYCVMACLSSFVPQVPGQMVILHTNINGGTFNSFLPVQPRLVFTQASNFGGPGLPSMVADPGPALQMNTTNSTWAYTNLGLPVLSSPGGMVDHDCVPTNLPVVYPATSNFFPGVSAPGATCAFPGGAPHKDLSTEMAMLAAHGVLPPCRPPGVGYAFGDGLGIGSPCPCLNFGQAGHGCENSALTGGALLYGSGEATAFADTLVLRVEGMPSTSSGLFFGGPNPFLPLGMGIPAGDGLGHLGAGFVRFGLKFADCGKVNYGAPLFDVAVHTRLGFPAAGTVSYLQFFYRNAAAAWCPPATFNTTNGYAVTWI